MSQTDTTRTPSGLVARLTVLNTGARPGVDVVQAHVRYPSSSGEPPEQLRAIARVDLGPSSSTTVSIPIPQTAFQRYTDGVLATAPGTSWVDIGQSSADLPVQLSAESRGSDDTAPFTSGTGPGRCRLRPPAPGHHRGRGSARRPHGRLPSGQGGVDGATGTPRHPLGAGRP